MSGDIFPVEQPHRVDRIRLRSDRWSRIQIIHSPWTGTDRTARFRGRCIVCGRPTFSFDDGENDPRGPLGDNTLHAVDLSPDESKPLCTCSACANVADSYEKAKEIGAKRGWEACRPARYADEVAACAWFAGCGNEATTTRPHPVLGDVPICGRCDAKVERLGGGR